MSHFLQAKASMMIISLKPSSDTIDQLSVSRRNSSVIRWSEKEIDIFFCSSSLFSSTCSSIGVTKAFIRINRLHFDAKLLKLFRETMTSCIRDFLSGLCVITVSRHQQIHLRDKRKKLTLIILTFACREEKEEKENVSSFIFNIWWKLKKLDERFFLFSISTSSKFNRNKFYDD